MVIFAALFIIFLWAVFRRLSGNQNIDGGIRENMEAGEVMEPLTPSSSSPRTTSGSEYEVFLCFRGEDTRKGFIGHLYEALVLHGISTFMDSEKLQKGEEIHKLLKYIDGSKIFVPIFSKSFAESRWCLKEVTKSVKCGKEIVPVFFGVEPSDVRNQKGLFEKAFEQHESDKKMNQDEVKKWREALKKIGSLSGFTLKHMNGDEAKLKRAIVKRVQSKVNKKQLEVAKHPIGIETRVQEVKKMLENGGNQDHHVDVVGIHGMGGLGKTTIAKAVYNDLAEGFNGTTCFLSNIREIACQPNGLVTLQKQLIGDILKVKDISLSDVAEGENLIKERASRKRVLLILDDVDSKRQLDALAGGRDWFGSGSVIIITTRDEKVLRDHNLKQHEIYKPEVLNEDQSRELFLQHSFNGEEPEGEYLRLSNEVVAAAGGLPLTIEVLGSLLDGVKDVKEWKNILEKLKTIPPDKVQQRLKLSYDSLDDMEKKIFLDISCFFIGRYRKSATYMWENYGWFPSAAIRVLEQRSLIKIDEKTQEFWMDERIRNMGRAIVKEESFGKLQNQSRIWSYRDYLDLLQRKVPMRTEGIMIYVEEGKPPFNVPRLQEWHDLRLFHIEGAKFDGSLHFPKYLKWLRLRNCQLQQPASVFIPEGIVVLDLSKNDNMANVLLVGSKSMVFDKLKILDLSWTNITITPDFSSAPCLVELILQGCKELVEVHVSVGNLKSLVWLDLTSCEKLEKLPDTICNLTSLEILDLKGCTSLSNLPEQQRDKMEFLKQLCLDETGIRSLLAFVGKLTRLQTLSIMKCQSLKSLPESLRNLDSLRELRVINDRMPKFIMSFGSLEVSTSCDTPWELMDALPRSCCESVRRLEFTNDKIEKLTDSIGRFVNLEIMRLRCRMLKALPDFIGKLKYVRDLTIQCHTLTLFDKICMLESIERLTVECINLKPLPFSSTTLLGTSTASGCENIKEAVPPPVRQSECFSQGSSKSVMKKFKHLYLCAKQITVTPDFSVAPSLERLTLTDCEMLTEVHHSIGTLENLKHLSITGCNALEGLPNTICHLISLKTVHLTQEFNPSSPPCRLQSITSLDIKDDQIEELSDCPLGQMENLKELRLECKSLKALPKWIRKLENLSLLKLECSSLETLSDCIASLGGLQTLQLSGCKNIKGLPDSMRRLESLRSLDLSRTGIGELPPWLGCLKHLTSLKLRDPENDLLLSVLSQLPSLEELDLSGSNFGGLPSCINNFSRLKVLDVSGCDQLVSIPHLSSPVLKELNVSGCKGLHSILPLNSSVLYVLDASNCTNLRGLPDFSNLWNLRRLFVGGCKSLESISGLKTIAGNIEELSLPGPSGVIQCSNLSDDFKNKAFVGASFRYLKDFRMTGNVIGRSHTGQQHLSFLFPDLRCNRYTCMWLELTLDGISSPVHVAVMQGDRVLFETTLAEDEFNKNDEGFRSFSFREGDEIFEYLQEGAATIQVSTDVSNLSTAQLRACMRKTHKLLDSLRI